MNTQEIQSRAIDILRFPLAIMVVAIHCFYFNVQKINVLSVSGEWDEFVVRWFINICSIILTDAAVPLFFCHFRIFIFLREREIY